MNKDRIISEIETRYEDTQAGIDVSWMANELAWMRMLLRQHFGDDPPEWVRLVLDDQEASA